MGFVFVGENSGGLVSRVFGIDTGGWVCRESGLLLWFDGLDWNLGFVRAGLCTPELYVGVFLPSGMPG